MADYLLFWWMIEMMIVRCFSFTLKHSQTDNPFSVPMQNDCFKQWMKRSWISWMRTYVMLVLAWTCEVVVHCEAVITLFTLCLFVFIWEWVLVILFGQSICFIGYVRVMTGLHVIDIKFVVADIKFIARYWNEKTDNVNVVR